MARVALTFNLVHAELLHARPVDSIAEYDSPETIEALRAALASGGHTVHLVEADETVAEQLRALRPDIVFNIAEGLRGPNRESHVPAICEMLGLPYTGSDPLTLSLCLNKARAKEILLHYGLTTPRFQVFRALSENSQVDLQFPLIVKLLHEGSAMGLSRRSVVEDESALREQLAYLFQTYQEPVIVEEFIEGREFTIGVLGNAPPWTLPIIEVVFNRPRGIVLFEADATVRPFIEQSGQTFSLPPENGHRSICPAETDPALTARLQATALRAYRALGCRDWCRMEMRLGPDDQLYILELNPIAGIDPSYWLPRAAQVAGLSYEALVNTILNYALQRYGLMA